MTILNYVIIFVCVNNNNVLNQMENENEILDRNVVEEPESLPPIYSSKAVLAFSVIFSTIFGGVLLMQNLRDIGKKRAANEVLIFSIVYTLAIMVLVSSIRHKTNSLSIILNVAGGFILTEHFFKRYIPDQNNYGKKAIWKPLIISILIIIPIILGVIYGGMN